MTNCPHDQEYGDDVSKCYSGVRFTNGVDSYSFDCKCKKPEENMSPVKYTDGTVSREIEEHQETQDKYNGSWLYPFVFPKEPIQKRTVISYGEITKQAVLNPDIPFKYCGNKRRRANRMHAENIEETTSMEYFVKELCEMGYGKSIERGREELRAFHTTRRKEALKILDRLEKTLYPNEIRTLRSALSGDFGVWVNAADDLGIYPASVTKNGVTVERTEWQDGWNSAMIALTERVCEMLRSEDKNDTN